MFSKKLSMGLQKSLKDKLKSLLVFRSVAANRVYSGVSDIDFMIILDKVENLNSPSSTVEEIGKSLFK